MPDYEYECRQCGKTFVRQQTFEEHDKHKKVQCPQCGSKQVEQLVGSVFVKTSKKS
jgi:putative FmdB family regulatory protein